MAKKKLEDDFEGFGISHNINPFHHKYNRPTNNLYKYSKIFWSVNHFCKGDNFEIID